MTPGKLNLSDVILQDLWVHLAALVAIVLGAGAWFVRAHFQSDPSSLELMFVIGGLSAMGLKIVNGSAAQLRQAALDTAFQAMRTAQTASAVAQAAAAAAPATPSIPQ